jgi:hypothetical protein
MNVRDWPKDNKIKEDLRSILYGYNYSDNITTTLYEPEYFEIK